LLILLCELIFRFGHAAVDEISIPVGVLHEFFVRVGIKALVAANPDRRSRSDAV